MTETSAHLDHQWFQRQLTRWAMFGMIYAAPCFLLAKVAGFQGSAANAAMFSGVVTWIAMMTFATTRGFWKRIEFAPFGKALRIGTIIRAGIAMISVVGAISMIIKKGEMLMLSILDYWVGLLSIGAVMGDAMEGKGAGFFQTYAITMLTGLGVFCSLGGITVGTWGIIKIGDRLKAFGEQGDEAIA